LQPSPQALSLPSSLTVGGRCALEPDEFWLTTFRVVPTEARDPACGPRYWLVIKCTLYLQRGTTLADTASKAPDLLAQSWRSKNLSPQKGMYPCIHHNSPLLAFSEGGWRSTQHNQPWARAPPLRPGLVYVSPDQLALVGRRCPIAHFHVTFHSPVPSV
jgi:hypothetical protein